MEAGRGFALELRNTPDVAPATHPSDPTKVERLTGLLAIAVPVSVVHYVDNVVNFSDYPQSSTIVSPTALVIGLAWFAFTAAGAAGYVMYRRAPSPRALLLLGLYSGSGLIGFGHYSVAGAFDMPWWRQLHIVADIVCGLAIFVFAIWAARRRPA